ncbi:hypothetical protein QFZ94_002132 [Paraburkholderia sp. JPY465]|uniref:hypothetical protein n=1 Tax=Paraburkholderia sp. JPY465 TaxID=3042285 RepID=UPI003D1E75FF
MNSVEVVALTVFPHSLGRECALTTGRILAAKYQWLLSRDGFEARTDSANPLPPSAVRKIVCALTGKPASRSIWESRVDDDYGASAIGCLGWVFVRDALTAAASELILSIARSSALSTSGLVTTSSTLPLKFVRPAAIRAQSCVLPFDGRIKALHEPRGGALVHAQGRNADVLSVQQSGVRPGIGNAQT